MTLVIAHRGASVDAPENTIQAFELAVAQGADMIETDLHLSKDGAVPLYHDSEIDDVPVGNYTLAELRDRIPGLPTLEEALDAVGDRIAFNLELKRLPDYDYQGLEERVLAEVNRRKLLDRTLFSCFYDTALADLRALSPSARIGLLVSPRSNFAIVERAKRLAAEAVHPQLEITTEALVSEIHAAGFRVYVFTVDDPDTQRRLLGWSVDGLFTNLPGPLRELIEPP